MNIASLIPEFEFCDYNYEVSCLCFLAQLMKPVPGLLGVS